MNETKRGINAAQLKWIAIVLMALNHICVGLADAGLSSGYFVNEGSWYVTRAAFIIFAYQIAEGVHFTHDRTKYILSLLIFAVISEMPFDLCFYSQPIYMNYQNVMWTLTLGAAASAIIEHYNREPLTSVVITLAAMVICTWLNTDYSALGIGTIVTFYYFRENRTKQLIVSAVIFSILVFADYLHMFVSTGDTVASALRDNSLYYLIKIELHGLTAWPLLMMYNGEKGKSINKWFYYCFYPGHLLLIYIVCELLLAG